MTKTPHFNDDVPSKLKERKLSLLSSQNPSEADTNRLSQNPVSSPSLCVMDTPVKIGKHSFKMKSPEMSSHNKRCFIGLSSSKENSLKKEGRSGFEDDNYQMNLNNAGGVSIRQNANKKINISQACEFTPGDLRSQQTMLYHAT